jgi:hypothetical protein
MNDAMTTWIAADPVRRELRNGLLHWNYHPTLGVSVRAADLDGASAELVAAIMQDTLLAAARGRVRDYRREEASYRDLANAMEALVAGVRM